MEHYTLHFDGSCGPKNPGGTAAYGYTLSHQGQVIDSGHGVIGTGPGMTNNLAELVAVAKGMEAFLEKHHNPTERRRLAIYGDSKLTIGFMAGGFRANPEKPYYPGYVMAVGARMRLKLSHVEFSFDWIPRAQNQHCDDLSKVHSKL